ncbi:MAG: hypothetical protein U0168_21860 [Nannocystaceae bacterium]
MVADAELQRELHARWPDASAFVQPYGSAAFTHFAGTLHRLRGGARRARGQGPIADHVTTSTVAPHVRQVVGVAAARARVLAVEVAKPAAVTDEDAA